MLSISSTHGKVIVASAVVISLLIGYGVMTMEKYAENFVDDLSLRQSSVLTLRKTLRARLQARAQPDATYNDTESLDDVSERVELLHDMLVLDEDLLRRIAGPAGSVEASMEESVDKSTLEISNIKYKYSVKATPYCGDTGAPHHDDVPRELSAMRRKYNESDHPASWGMRGVPYLWEKHRIFLQQSIEGTARQRRVVVRNVAHRAETAACSCANLKIAIWIRFRGPEIIAGLATQDPVKCEWLYQFPEGTRSGKYNVDVKLLSVNGERDSNGTCNTRPKAMVPDLHKPYRQV